MVLDYPPPRKGFLSDIFSAGTTASELCPADPHFTKQRNQELSTVPAFAGNTSLCHFIYFLFVSYNNSSSSASFS